MHILPFHNFICSILGSFHDMEWKLSKVICQVRSQLEKIIIKRMRHPFLIKVESWDSSYLITLKHHYNLLLVMFSFGKGNLFVVIIPTFWFINHLLLLCLCKHYRNFCSNIGCLNVITLIIQLHNSWLFQINYLWLCQICNMARFFCPKHNLIYSL
jgi:hypothetical protein